MYLPTVQNVLVRAFYVDVRVFSNASHLLLPSMPLVVEAERKLGFDHSHNTNINWDTFDEK